MTVNSYLLVTINCINLATPVNILNCNDWYQVSGILSNQNIIMAKKLFLNTQRERFIPTAQTPSVSREEPESEVATSSRNSPVSVIAEQLPMFYFERDKQIFSPVNSKNLLFISMNALLH